jgi:hypothetical protein
MSKIAELLGLKAKIEELENQIQNETITFTKEELMEYTKTIATATANGVKHELSKIDNFNFKPALMTVREEGELVIKVSRTKVISEIINNTDWELKDENVESVMDDVLSIMEK